MLLTLIAQSAITAPSAPPTSFRPTVTPSQMRSIGPRSRERVRVSIVVSAEGETLYSGTLWVSAQGPASWRQTVQEAPDPACPPAGYFDPRGNEASVRIMPGPDREGGGTRFMVTARWQRTLREECSGARTAELRDVVRLDDGPVTLRGDAGLTVTIRRK